MLWGSLKASKLLLFAIIVLIVLFYIGEYFEMIDWSIVSAIAAAAAAVFAGYHIYQDGKWRKLERTFSHNPYRNEKFLQAIDNLKKAYPCFADRQCTKVVESKIPKKQVPDIVLSANLWGQMAMEYNAGQLDKKVAKNLLKPNFVKFCKTFNKWLTSEDRGEIYKTLLELYKKWN